MGGRGKHTYGQTNFFLGIFTLIDTRFNVALNLFKANLAVLHLPCLKLAKITLGIFFFRSMGNANKDVNKNT